MKFSERQELEMLDEMVEYGVEVRMVSDATAEILRNHIGFVPIAMYGNIKPLLGEVGCIHNVRYVTPI